MCIVYTQSSFIQRINSRLVDFFYICFKQIFRIFKWIFIDHRHIYFLTIAFQFRSAI